MWPIMTIFKSFPPFSEEIAAVNDEKRFYTMKLKDMPDFPCLGFISDLIGPYIDSKGP